MGRVEESLRVLKSGGGCVVLGANARDEANLKMRPFYFGHYDPMGSPRDFGGLLRLVEDGSFRPPVIDRTFALADAADAHRHLESGAGFGKIVLDFG